MNVAPAPAAPAPPAGSHVGTDAPLGTSHLEINVSNFFTFLLGAAVGAFTMAALQAASIIVREMTTLQEELDDM